MPWKRMLAYLSGSVNAERLRDYGRPIWLPLRGFPENSPLVRHRLSFLPPER